jgi:autotransporter-associated beta strand protein
MNKLIMAAIRCSLMFLVPSVTYAISAQWDLDPISGDWNTAANWTPDGVPNGPADIATFGLSNTTNVSISEDTEVDGITFTSAATNPYTITLNRTLTLSGNGITNNSGIIHDFYLADPNFEGTQMRFINSASAGNASIFIDADARISFLNSSTAGSATIGTHRSFISFSDNSSAGTALIEVDDVSELDFSGNSTAGNASIFVAGGSGGVFFGEVMFNDSSTAGNATLLGAGAFFFSGSSTGGTARIELFQANDTEGILDISTHNAPGVTIGSIAGVEGTFVFLGANNLTVGSNNLSTTFSGVIQDGGFFGGGGTGGSLTKIGSGTLILSGANTYTGETNVNGGVLQVDGSITSNTFVNQTGTLAGTGTINGNVTNNGRVSPGTAGAPGILTIAGNYTQAQYARLMIQIAGMSPDQFSVLNVLGNANLNGFLDPALLNGFVPTLGDSFIFLNYASLTGEFSRIRHRVFDNGMLQWSVSYEANHAILTVEQHVPDHGSTLLLLTLGLLGLMAYRRQSLPRKDSLTI